MNHNSDSHTMASERPLPSSRKEARPPSDDRTQSPVEMLGFSKAELEELLLSRGHGAFHGRQIFSWLYNRQCTDIAAMTDLPRDLRAQLQAEFRITPLQELECAKSSDGTEKYLLGLADGSEIETVLVPDRKITTACVSSQVGCALACRFCATGTLKLKRDLTGGEIISQLLHLRARKGERAFNNIVFMGMGEPLHNFEALVKALRIITDPAGLAVSPRRITVSTSGITPRIRRLAESGLGVNLAISLHSAIQSQREKIMPVAKTFGLDKLISAAQFYAKTVGKRITFEYVLLRGLNDTPGDGTALAALTRKLDCKVNLLPYNPTPGLDFTRPQPEEVDRFAAGLAERGVTVTVRKSRGRDVAAACGQLAARKLGAQP